MIGNQCEKCGVYYEDGERHHCGPMFWVREAGSQKAVQVFESNPKSASITFAQRNEVSYTRPGGDKDRYTTVEVLEFGRWAAFRVFVYEVTEYYANRESELGLE